MIAHTIPESQTDHPAPQRATVGVTALSFGILGAPAAWILQELISYTYTSTLCNIGDLQNALPGAASPLVGTISVIAMVFAIAAGVTALRSWRKTRDEQSGSSHHLLEVREGRTRFLAMCGLLTSAGFLIALIFSAAVLFVGPVCG